MVEQGRPVPRSRQIADVLRRAVAEGLYGPGDRLPSERELVAQHGVARNTAREAVDLLQREGLVTVRHGKGAFVRESPRLVRIGAQRYSRRLRDATGLSPFRAEARRLGMAARVDVPDISRVEPPADVAERLGVETDSESVVRRVNHYFLDDEPVQIGVTYIPWSIAQGSVLATEADTGTGSIYARFAELGYDIAQVREEVTARMPTPDEVKTLVVPHGVPVIEVLHTGIDRSGRPFEATRFVMRSDRTALDYLLPIED